MTKQLTPEQAQNLAQAILTNNGYVVIDVSKCKPEYKRFPHKNCYRIQNLKSGEQEITGLVTKTNRIIRTLQFANKEIRKQYIENHLGKHTEIPNDEKI